MPQQNCPQSYLMYDIKSRHIPSASGDEVLIENEQHTVMKWCCIICKSSRCLVKCCKEHHTMCKNHLAQLLNDPHIKNLCPVCQNTIHVDSCLKKNVNILMQKSTSPHSTRSSKNPASTKSFVEKYSKQEDELVVLADKNVANCNNDRGEEREKQSNVVTALEPSSSRKKMMKEPLQIEEENHTSSSTKITSSSSNCISRRFKQQYLISKIRKQISLKTFKCLELLHHASTCCKSKNHDSFHDAEGFKDDDTTSRRSNASTICTSTRCHFMKASLYHLKNCNLRIVSGSFKRCPRCTSVINILKKHAQYCTNTDGTCPVLLCEKIKRDFSRK